MKKIKIRFNQRTAELLLGLIMVATAGIIAGNTEVISTKIHSVNDEKKEYIVAVDAGHGGQDPGKVGINDSLEKDVNLAIALKVKKLLESDNIVVHMTRESDEGLYNEGDANKKISDLNKRCSLIDGWNSDIAVSIHQNSYSDSSVKGGQVFYYAASEKGTNLAQSIQVELDSVCEKTRPAKANRDYYMLLNVKCPMVIVECGFLSNWEEAELLNTEEYQQKMAEAIVRGIEEYFKAK